MSDVNSFFNPSNSPGWGATSDVPLCLATDNTEKWGHDMPWGVDLLWHFVISGLHSLFDQVDVQRFRLWLTDQHSVVLQPKGMMAVGYWCCPPVRFLEGNTSAFETNESSECPGPERLLSSSQNAPRLGEDLASTLSTNCFTNTFSRFACLFGTSTVLVILHTLCDLIPRMPCIDISTPSFRVFFGIFWDQISDAMSCFERLRPEALSGESGEAKCQPGTSAKPSRLVHSCPSLLSSDGFLKKSMLVSRSDCHFTESDLAHEELDSRHSNSQVGCIHEIRIPWRWTDWGLYCRFHKASSNTW